MHATAVCRAGFDTSFLTHPSKCSVEDRGVIHQRFESGIEPTYS